MWNYFISVYYMANRNKNGDLNAKEFEIFLDRTIAFIWGYAIIHPGVNALRTPLFAEMLNIVNLNEVTFSEFKFNKEKTRSAIVIYDFKNGRPITRSEQSPVQQVAHLPGYGKRWRKPLWWRYSGNNYGSGCAGGSCGSGCGGNSCGSGCGK